jgi:hypothetical protein
MENHRGGYWPGDDNQSSRRAAVHRMSRSGDDRAILAAIGFRRCHILLTPDKLTTSGQDYGQCTDRAQRARPAPRRDLSAEARRAET